MQSQDPTLRYYEDQAGRYPEIRARPIQAYTSELEQEAIRPYVLSASRILDLGCGEGRIARWIVRETIAAGRAPIIHASDFSPEMIETARSLANDLPISFSIDDATALQVPNATYDLIVSMTAPNNFPNIRAAVSEIHRALVPGGVFIGVIINKDELARYARYFYLMPYYLVRWLMPRASNYVRILYSREDLIDLFGDRFEILELRGLRILPDFLPEFPLNFWKPLFPLTRALIKLGEGLDRRLAASRAFGRRARFHLIVARARK